VLLGAATAFLLDPQSGKRRRALLRDQAVHFRHMLPRRLRGAVRQSEGRMEGVLHEVGEHLPGHVHEPPPDLNQFITQRVASELGRDRRIPWGDINLDAADGIVHVRGTVADEELARHIGQEAAKVADVRAVVSLLHTPDGRPVGGIAGDVELAHGAPRAAVQGEEVRRQLTRRWPALTDADILATDGHVDRLVALIGRHTGEPEAEVRQALEAILLSVV
jgi:hypothetical protein